MVPHSLSFHRFSFPELQLRSRFRSRACGPLVVFLLILAGGFAAGVVVAQTITEFPLGQYSHPGSIALGSDGALWFTDWDYIGRITTGGVIAEFKVPSGSTLGSFSNDAIASGPDGNLWFAENYYNRIGRITPSGEIAEFDIPWVPVSCGFLCVKGAPSPIAITAGPDGNLWFTEGVDHGAGVHKIGRMTTAGLVTGNFLLPTSGGHPPQHIVAGQDGALWFDDSDKIGRISIDGVITEFTNPIRDSNGSSYIGGMTAGPDGAIWYTCGHSIGRITGAGIVTELLLPTAVGGIITAGPDGNLWFFTSDYQIGRITTAAGVVVTMFPLPNDFRGAGDMTAGPDAALWITEPNSNKIGRIITSAERETPEPVQTPIGQQPRVVPFR